MWARTWIPIFAMMVVVMSAPDAKPVAEEDDDDRPFSIGLGVLAPSYSQKLGKDGKTRLDFHQDEKGFSYTVGNADPKDKNFFKQYQSVQFNKPAPAPQNEIGNNQHHHQKDNGRNNQRDLANAAQTYRDTSYGNSAGAYQGYNQGVRAAGVGAGGGRGAYGDVATTRNIYAENGVGNDRRTYAGLAAIRTPEFDRFFQAGVTNNQVVGAPSQQNNIHGYSRTYNGPAEGVLAFANDPVSPRFASEYASAARPSRHGGRGYGQEGGQVAGGNYGNDFGGILANYGQGGQGVFGGGAAATRQNSYQQGGQPQGFAFDASGFPPIPGYDPNAPQKAEQNQEQQYNPAPVAQPAPRQAPRQVPVPVFDQGSYGGGYGGAYDQGRQQQQGQGYGQEGQGYGQQVAFSNQASYGPRGTYGSVGHIANQPYARAPQFQSVQGGQRGQSAGQQNLIGVSFGDAKNPYGGAFNYGGSITHHAGGGAPAQPIAQPQGGHGGQGGQRGRA